MAENRASGAPPHSKEPSGVREASASSTMAAVGPSVARVTPPVSLVEWHDREKQEQIDRLLEMVDELRKDVVAGRVTTLALAGVAEGEEFFQWEGKDPSVLYVLELAKLELLHGVRFADASGEADEEEEEDE